MLLDIFLGLVLNYMQERLQKILSQKGICSRRKAEEYILAGLVSVNGKVAVLGQKADPETDAIEVDGQVAADRQEMLYYLLHKPHGVLTTNLNSTKEHPTPTVRDLLPKKLQGVLYPVGRLDKDTSGLLLCTNDGVLAYRLTHPKFDHEKEYEVITKQPVEPAQLGKMRSGLVILGEKLKPVVITKISNTIFRIVLTEGKNRQIRRMCRKVGIHIKILKRVRIMNITDDQLQAGKIRELTSLELKEMLESLEITHS